VIAKGGNTGFYSSNLQILPSERVVIALIASGKASGDKLTEPILTALLRDRGLIASEGEPARPPASQPIPAALTRYAGYYAAENDAWKVSIDPLYDSRVDGDEVYAPAGSYVFFAGVAGDTFHVRTKSMEGVR
jgi:hypothetical protein